ncbi:MAG: hypothetical protein M1333_01495 [Patescibacteria group bacterium]|nr:hypothetical protein [Patescibacteria group bacterium]
MGYVGGAVRKYFESKSIKPLLYDKFKLIGSIDEVNKAEVVFICTPTPYDPKRGFDLSAVENAIQILKKDKIVIIKSTVLPGTTQALQKKYPRHKILFNPEFLREATADDDMAHPDRQILGVTKKSVSLAPKIMSLLPKAPYQKIMPALEAEVVKYMANAFLALKVVYANEFYDICKALKANYNLVKEAVVQDPRIADSHFDIWHGNYRGYGGSCFPKDVNAIIQLAQNRKIKAELLKAMRDINRKYLKQSGLSEEHFLRDHHKRRR